MTIENNNIWYLEEINLQQLFCPIAIGSIMDHASKEYKKGDFIYFPTDSTSKVFFIAKGRVKIGSYSTDGKEIIKTVLQKGELFGELGLLGASQHNEFAQTMESTEVCIMPLEAVKSLMQQSQVFGLEITRIIGNKLIKTQRRLESLVFKDARTRIIEFLHDLATERGQRVGYELVVRKFFTHQEIANLTGTSRQTVTTILNELREDNYIYFDRRKLLVRDIKQLEKLIA